MGVRVSEYALLVPAGSGDGERAAQSRERGDDAVRLTGVLT
jgi:hypothetical protein